MPPPIGSEPRRPHFPFSKNTMIPRNSAACLPLLALAGSLIQAQTAPSLTPQFGKSPAAFFIAANHASLFSFIFAFRWLPYWGCLSRDNLAAARQIGSIYFHFLPLFNFIYFIHSIHLGTFHAFIPSTSHANFGQFGQFCFRATPLFHSPKMETLIPTASLNLCMVA